MLCLKCPWCGPRAEVEFRCGGQTHITRPVLSPELSDREWAEYLFYRENPKGVHFERWYHQYGCGRWFNAARCTVSHKILAIYKMSDAKPVIGEEAL